MCRLNIGPVAKAPPRAYASRREVAESSFLRKKIEKKAYRLSGIGAFTGGPGRRGGHGAVQGLLELNLPLTPCDYIVQLTANKLLLGKYMIDLHDIRPLSDFQRHTRNHIRRLNKSVRPQVLTINGQAALVVQIAEAYHAMLDRVEAAGQVKTLRKSVAQAVAKRGRPARQVIESIAQQYKYGRFH